MEVLAIVGLAQWGLRILWMVEGDLALKAQFHGDGRNGPACCMPKVSSSLALLYLKMPHIGS